MYANIHICNRISTSWCRSSPPLPHSNRLTQQERERYRDRQAVRQRFKDRVQHTETELQTNRIKHSYSQTHTDIGTDRDRKIARDTNTERDRQTEADRHLNALLAGVPLVGCSSHTLVLLENILWVFRSLIQDVHVTGHALKRTHSNSTTEHTVNTHSTPWNVDFSSYATKSFLSNEILLLTTSTSSAFMRH